MAYTSGGVTLVAEGVQQFIKSLDKANAALERFSKTLGSFGTAQAQLATTGTAVTRLAQTTTRGMGQSATAVAEFGTSVAAAGSPLAQMEEALARVQQRLTEHRAAQEASGTAAREMGLAVAAGAETATSSVNVFTTAVSNMGDRAKNIFDQISGTDAFRIFQDLANSGKLAGDALDAIINRMGVLTDAGLSTGEAVRVAMAEVVGGMNDAQQAALGFETIQDQTQQTTKDTESLTDAFAKLGVETRQLAIGLTALGTAGMGALTAIGLTASRIEELEILLEVTRSNTQKLAEADYDFAKASQLTATAVQDEAASIRELHLSGLVANQTVAQMIRYNLDWTKATELARLAQDAATFAMQDSSVALQGLLHGITTLQPRVLRTYGLFVNLDIAYRKFAEANRIAVADLTVTQRQQAALNEVLAQAPQIAGAYEAAMGTAAKQIRSLKTDIIDLSEAFGEELTPILDQGVGILRDFLDTLAGLPDWFQAAIVYGGGAAATMSSLTGTILLAGPKVAQLADGFRGLAAAMNLSALQLIGAGGLIGLLAGAVGVYVSVTRAHEEEARAIFEAATSYTNYIGRMKDAGRETYILAEYLYDLAKAAEDAGRAVDAIELRNEEKEAQELAKEVARLTDEWEFNSQGMEVNVTKSEVLRERLKEMAQRLTENQLLILGNAMGQRLLAQEMGLTSDEMAEFIPLLENIIFLERTRRDIMGQTRESDWDAWRELNEVATEYEDARREAFDWQVWAAQQEKAIFDKRVQQHEKELEYQEEIAKAVQQSVWAQIDAWHTRNQDFIDLDRDYASKAADLWDEYAEAVREAEADLAAFHAGTLDELIDLDEKYQKERADLWREYQQDLYEAEQKFQQDLADLNTKRIQDIEDENRKYAQKQADLLTDLNRDLEDLERSHLDKMRDLEADYYADLEDLAQDYADKVTAITEKYASERQAILDKYSFEEVQSFDDRRQELMDRIRQLEQELSEFQVGVSPYTMDRTRKKQELEKLKKELEELKQEELDALEDRKQEELDELKKWLAEEEAARQEAYEEAKAKEEERYQQTREDRLRRYQEQLDDLSLAHQRELEEIQQQYERQRQALDDALQRERQTLADRYAERLSDTEREYNAERDLIEQKLQEQLDTAKEKYGQGLDDLKDWYDDQKQAIIDKYDDRIKEIEYQEAQAVLKAQQEFERLPAAFEPTWDELIRQTQDKMQLIVDAFIAGINAMFDAVGAHSPADVMIKLGESMLAGFEAGLPPDAINRAIDAAFNAEAMQTNIQAAIGGMDLSTVIPPQTAFVPPVANQYGGDSFTNNLTVTANYQRYQSEASLRDTLQGLQMSMNALPRR